MKSLNPKNLAILILSVSLVLSLGVLVAPAFTPLPTPPPQPVRDTMDGSVRSETYLKAKADLYLGRYAALAPRHVDVVFMGDSNTWYAMLPEATGNKEAVTRAIPGFTSWELERLIPAVKALTPDVVYLNCGVNDLCYGDTSEDTAWGVRKLWRSLGCRVVVQSIIRVAPGYENSAEVNAKINAANQIIQQFSAEDGMKYVDLNHALAPDGALPESGAWDHMHLNGSAIALWAKAIR